MAKTPAPAKTPSVAIARVLRGLGLKQGTDFRCKGEYRRGVRVGTYVSPLTNHADQVVADNADLIERLVGEAGFSVVVSVYFTASGRMWTWVANYGVRTRETAPAADKTVVAPGTRDERPAAAAQAASNGLPKLKLGTARSAFENFGQRTRDERPAATAADAAADPYAGLPQKSFGGLTWACEEPGQTWFFQNTADSARYTLRVYRGRVQSRGWYLSGPGLPAEGCHAGATLTIAATAAERIILDREWLDGRVESAKRKFPQGTRVQGVDSYGVICMGTVNGAGWGVVTDRDHENYGLTWVDVDWDEMPHNRGTGRRSRLFTNTLMKV